MRGSGLSALGGKGGAGGDADEGTRVRRRQGDRNNPDRIWIDLKRLSRVFEDALTQDSRMVFSVS